MAVLLKSQQTEKILRESIISGRWGPGDLLPAERDLLAELGVSRTTLRDALNTLTNDGFIVRKPRVGTSVAPTLELGTVTVITMASDLASPFGYVYQTIVSIARQRMQECMYRATLTVGEGPTKEEFLSSVNLFDRSVADRTLGAISLADAREVEERLRAANIASVVISGAPEMFDYCVSFDYEAMTLIAAEELARTGHADFALMYRSTDSGHADEVTRAIAAHTSRCSLRAVGFDESRLVCVPYAGEYDFSAALDTFKEWWASPRRRSAMFFTDDALFDVTSRAILELGIRVPQDLAVITQSNMGRQFHFPVNVTRVSYDPAEVVDAAWNILRRVVNGRTVDRPKVRIRPRLEPGESL